MYMYVCINMYMLYNGFSPVSKVIELGQALSSRSSEIAQIKK